MASDLFDHIEEGPILEARAKRLESCRVSMLNNGLEGILVTSDAQLAWLIGYAGIGLERPTILVMTKDATPVLLVPLLEAPRVREDNALFNLLAYGETEDPLQKAHEILGGATKVAISDDAPSIFLLRLMNKESKRVFSSASVIFKNLRAVKDELEISFLTSAGQAADRVANLLVSGEIELLGKSEREVSKTISELLISYGNDEVGFAIVAAGENGASPHHEAGDRIIRETDQVVCDFGGKLATPFLPRYCSDITRTVFLSEPRGKLKEIYELVAEAQEAAFLKCALGVNCEEIDFAARSVIEAAGYGQYFIHRTGHGIGVEYHEDPYIIQGNTTKLLPGHSFSIEPGIYIPGEFGVRIEDIVIMTPTGPKRVTEASRDITVVQ